MGYKHKVRIRREKGKNFFELLPIRLTSLSSAHGQDISGQMISIIVYIPHANRPLWIYSHYYYQIKSFTKSDVGVGNPALFNGAQIDS